MKHFKVQIITSLIMRIFLILIKKITSNYANYKISTIHIYSYIIYNDWNYILILKELENDECILGILTTIHALQLSMTVHD